MFNPSFKTMCAFFAAAAALQGAESNLQVRTASGVVEGKREDTVRAFLGIPYAAPPVGDRRWQPPAPVAPWDGVRPATAFGSRPMQPVIFHDMIFRDPGCSEDCLTLNIWTPAEKAEARLPVMVWIFGGGFIAGGTSEQRQDGARLAKQGVVVVSMNYRLGVFGFFVHPELAAESPHHAAGNYGLMDQLAAIRWVHDNIAAFGGDPKNVTIFGESAGSFSVSAQMASPLAHGLFQKAIGESGAAFYSSGLAQESLATRAAADAEYVGKQTGVHTLAELRAMPAQALMDAVMKTDEQRYRFSLDVDGYFLPEPVADLFAAGKQNDVPLLAGWNHDEGGVSLPPGTPAIESMKKTAQETFGDDADEFLRLYPSTTEEQAARSGADFAGDRFIALSTWAWLEAQTKTGKQPVFRYHFDRAPPTNFYGQPSGAYHSADILYVFDSFDAQPQVAWTPTDREVSRVVQGYWTNFARTGNPNGPNLPTWPTYGPRDGWPVMHLNAPPEARPDERRPRYEFLLRKWRK